MIARATSNEWDDDYEEDLYVLPGDIQVGEPYETSQLLDRWGDPIEPTPQPIGFTQ